MNARVSATRVGENVIAPTVENFIQSASAKTLAVWLKNPILGLTTPAGTANTAAG